MTNMHQGYIEAYRLHGYFKPLHIVPWRKRAIVLQTPQGLRVLSWSEEADTAFKQLKLFLTRPLIMTAPWLDETLLIYIAATSCVVSTAIVVEREEVGHAYKVQCLVYFISEVLNESKTLYPQVQKLLYAILITSRKLRHYFEYYKIAVVTEFPLGDILHNKEANGRII